MKGLLFTAVVLFSATVMFAQSPFPDFPPSNVTRTMDRDQMVWQLGITFPQLPPKLQDPMAPPNTWPSNSNDPEGNWTDAAGHTITRSGFGLWNNYDDTEAGFYPGSESWRLGEYTPIDLLKMHNGTIITTPEQWWNERRPEILKDVTGEFWGVIPPADQWPRITWSVTPTTGVRNGVAYKQKAITGNIDISGYPQVRNVPRISATLRVPADVEGCVPVLIVFTSSFGLNTYWDRVQPYGWGVCAYSNTALQPDNGQGLTSYLIGLINKGNWRKPSDWGTLAAWSWGISRLIDYLETDLDVDASQIGVTGNSRYGKATLVAMAYDQRIAVAFPSMSGSLGAKMNRRHWGQDAENSGWDQEYHWMAGNFFKYHGELIPGQYLPRKIELCPVDAHSLFALCAPRPVFINGSPQDHWVDPYGEYLAEVGATPVYELLGKKGIILNGDDKPQLDVGYLEGDLAFRWHTGFFHQDTPDFPDFMLFASKYIKVAGKTVVNLSPPDHKYQTIKLSDFGVSIPYDCACLSNGVITKVTSDEAENGEDDGNSTNDIVIANDFKSVDLRRERSGIGNGRIYSIYISVTDASGAVQSTKVQVQVPLDFDTPVVDDGPVYEVLGGDVPGLAKTHNEADQKEITNAGNVPTEFALQQNYPNPFNPTTTIDFAIPKSGFYTLKVYNPFGQEVAELVNGQLESGFYRINFDASKLASGLYIYALKGNNLNITKKMTLLR